MTNGQKVVASALAEVGVAEATGRNDGAKIEAWQRAAEAAYRDEYPVGGLLGAAWCAIFVRSRFVAAGVPIDPRLVHPYTGYICQRADQLGGLAPRGLAPPGSLFIRCGVHVGIVVRDRGNGLIDTVEGNAGDAVRQLVRSKADWRIIVPPGIEDDPTPPVVMRDSFGFDDLRLRPTLYGGWSTPELRDHKMAAFSSAHPGLWTAPVRVDRDAPYAFRAGAAGTYGATWRFGGWTTKARRDELLDAYCARVGHRSVRTWRKRVPVPADLGGSATGAGAISTT